MKTSVGPILCGVLRLIAVAAVLASVACGGSPNAPTSTRAPDAAAAAPATEWAVLTGGPSTATLAQCLAGSRDASCFSTARVRKTAISPTLSAPVFNNNQPVLNTGTTVTLSWTPPAIGGPTSYFIEASTTPGGAEIAFDTGNTSTTYVAPGVFPGTYYVRIRAVDAGGVGPASNEVQVVVSSGGTVGSCPSAPRGLTASQSGGAVTLTWQPPSSGVPASYVIQAGSAPGLSNIAPNLDLGSTATTLTARVAAGSYYVRVYAKSNSCASPTFLGPSSNEILLTVASPGWSGQIVCNLAITGPSSYHHNETQTWIVGGPATPIASNRAYYPVQWSAQGSGGSVLGTWTINSTAATDITVTIRSDGAPLIDRTTAGILIRRGLAGAPTSYDLYEMDFATIVGGSNATSVSGTWSRASAGGDAPVQPGGSVGTLTCTWSLTNQ